MKELKKKKNITHTRNNTLNVKMTNEDHEREAKKGKKV